MAGFFIASIVCEICYNHGMKKYTICIDEEMINSIYSNATVEEIEEIMHQLINNELNVNSVIQDAYSEGYEIEWSTNE